MKKLSWLTMMVLLVTVMTVISMCAMVATASDGDVASDPYETTTATTAVHCYATHLEYDDSPMQVGETRAIRFYHPATNTATGGSIYEVSENLSISYEEGSDTVYVTALSEGSAKLYICERDCAFGAYAYVTVEALEPVLCFPKGDVDRDGTLSTSDARLVLQYCLSDVMALQDDTNLAADFDGNGQVETSDVRSMLIAISNS